jgi:hypothetical protein
MFNILIIKPIRWNEIVSVLVTNGSDQNMTWLTNKYYLFGQFGFLRLHDNSLIMLYEELRSITVLELV